MKIQIKKQSSTRTSTEWLVTLPGGLSKVFTLSEQDCIVNRMSMQDLIENLAVDFAEEEGYKNAYVEGELQ